MDETRGRPRLDVSQHEQPGPTATARNGSHANCSMAPLWQQHREGEPEMENQIAAELKKLRERIKAVQELDLPPATMLATLLAGFQMVHEETAGGGIAIAKAFDEGVSHIPGVLNGGYPY